MIPQTPRLFALAALLALPLLTAAAPVADIAETLALPLASGLTGAADTARFAWIENAAGSRSIWLGAPGQPARQLVPGSGDDGVELSDLTLSRDGSELAFVRGGDGEWADDTPPNPAAAALAPAQQLLRASTAGGAPEVIGEGHAPAFAPDGRTIAFTRRGDIWLWDRTGGARKIAHVTGSVSALEWSPDGRTLTFVDERPDHSFVALLDVGGANLRYCAPTLGYSEAPVFSPDGRSIALIAHRDPPQGATPGEGSFWLIRACDVASGTARTVWTAPAGIGGVWSGTRGRNLLWGAGDVLVFPWEQGGWRHAYALDTKDGGIPRALTAGTFELESMLLSRDGSALIYAANPGDNDRRHLWRVNLAGGAPVSLAHGAGDESLPVLGADALAVLATDVTHPAHPALIAQGVSLLGNARAAPAMIAPQAVTFAAADGAIVHAQLFRSAHPGRRPALVFVHGGPRRQMLLGYHYSWYYSNAYALNQHFAALGYDVLSVNYRSGTGYGQTFREAPAIGRDGASEYRDVLAAGKWLAAQSFVDPARIGIWGGSWGGYLTALALARDSDLFKAGADFHGVHTMVRGVGANLSPAQADAAHQLQWSSSPMGAIERWRSPVLLIHGDDDRNVDFAQSLILARELTARGVPLRELVFPNERHDFMRYADWLTSYRAVEAFFDQTLMHRAATAP